MSTQADWATIKPEDGLEAKQEPVTVKVTKVTPSTTIKTIKTRKGNEIEIPMPFHIRIETADFVVADDDSLATKRVDDWNKKFYLSKDGNFVNFTRDHLFLALCTVLKLDTSEQFSALDLVGKKFEAIVIGNDDNAFINWYKTFQINGINVPDKSYFEPMPIEPSYTPSDQQPDLDF